MKKSYVSPVAERIEFSYSDQVVASNNPPSGSCGWNWYNYSGNYTGGCSKDYWGSAT